MTCFQLRVLNIHQNWPVRKDQYLFGNVQADQGISKIIINGIHWWNLPNKNCFSFLNDQSKHSVQVFRNKLPKLLWRQLQIIKKSKTVFGNQHDHPTLPYPSPSFGINNIMCINVKLTNAAIKALLVNRRPVERIRNWNVSAFSRGQHCKCHLLERTMYSCQTISITGLIQIITKSTDQPDLHIPGINLYS